MRYASAMRSLAFLLAPVVIASPGMASAQANESFDHLRERQPGVTSPTSFVSTRLPEGAKGTNDAGLSPSFAVFGDTAGPNRIPDSRGNDSISQSAAGPHWLRWELPRGVRGTREQRGALAIGAGLVFLDRYTIRWFDSDLGDPVRRVDSVYKPFNALADGLVLGSGLIATWAVQRGPARETTTTAMAALANATVATTLVKGLVGKQRPDQSMEPHYRGPSLVYSSFPSGHTAAATSVAHVFARKNPRNRLFWYGFATLVAVSRVSSAKHWMSDTVWGAAVGVVSAEGALGGNGPAFRLRF